MRRCNPIPKDACRPTPFVGYAEAARWISFTYCQAVDLTNHLSCDLNTLLIGRTVSYRDFPLLPDQCLRLVESIQAQLPTVGPDDCCTELSFRLKESDIYLLKKWLHWMDNWLAETAQLTDASTIGGTIAMKKIESLYQKLTEFRKRLAAPIGKTI